MPATELTPIAHHLFKATEMIRQLPIQSLSREEFYTNIYNLICTALDLIVTDEMKGAKDPKKDPGLQQSLKGDLSDLLGG